MPNTLFDKLLVGGLVASMLAWLACALALDARSASGGFSFQPSKIDIESHAPSEKSRFLSKLVNGTNQTVYIDDIGGSCGCTRLWYDKRVLGPGEEMDLNGEISISERVRGKVIAVHAIGRTDDGRQLSAGMRLFIEIDSTL